MKVSREQAAQNRHRVVEALPNCSVSEASKESASRIS